MSAPLAPATIPELLEIVRSSSRLLAIGAGTKPRPSQVDGTKVSMTQLRGIVEYDPSEFTFTALAGTPVKDLITALAESRQYLPFDPFFVEAEATLGGTVAAGLSGPGRARFGGIKDFILGARFIDGMGRLLRVGGKVVKNAAGFDLPKFFVGSLGRFGVLTELTFKVFPVPTSTLTLALEAQDIEAAARILMEIGAARWDAEALDIRPDSCKVCLRLAGPVQALEQIAKEILARWPGEKLSPADAQTVWSDLRECRWAYTDGPLIKVVLTPAVLPALFDELKALERVRIHVSGGGNMALISLASSALPSETAVEGTSGSAADLDQILRRLRLSAVALRGDAALWLGAQFRPNIGQGIKHALDPQRRFPDLDE